MATKRAKKNNEVKIDFNDSVKAIKGTAQTMNKESKKVVTEVMEDIKSNVTMVNEYAKTKVKKAVETTTEIIKENATPEVITGTAKSINNMGLKIADSVVEGITNNSDKWIKLTDKTVKNGLKITAKQQDIFFETVADMKGQMESGVKRFKKIFSLN